jgi:hypothetical protein
MPLRRNLLSAARDAIPSPRRPRTAVEDDGRSRSDSLDMLSEEKQSSGGGGGSKTTVDGAEDVYSNSRFSHRQSLPNVRRPDSTSTTPVSTPPQGLRKQVSRTLVRKSSSWTSRMEEFQMKEGKADSSDLLPASSERRDGTADKTGDSASTYNSPSQSNTGRKSSALHFAGSSSLNKSYSSSSSPPTAASTGAPSVSGRSSARAIAAGYEGSPVRNSSKIANQKPADANTPHLGYDAPSLMTSPLTTRKPSLFSKVTRRSSGGGAANSDI